MTMGEKILKLRKARGWNQEDLAEQIGVSRQAVSRWESDSAKPDADKINAICDLFGISADYLLRENYQGEPGAVSAQPPQQQRTAIGEAIHNMTLKQWAGLGLVLIGSLILIFLWLLYFFKNTNYYYSDLAGMSYTGFPAFLRAEEVYGLWWATIIGIVMGWFYLIAKKGPLAMLWEQAGEFFNWD